MSKRYDAVMEKIEVTDEMRRRILAHIDGMDLEAAPLSELVGFEIKEVTALPFQVDGVTYASYFGTLSQIKYVGEERSLTLRQSAGEGDNSGDFNVYAVTEVREMGDWSVTLKGDGENWTLAIWSDGTYAYSAHAEPGFTLSEWERVIAGL